MRWHKAGAWLLVLMALAHFAGFLQTEFSAPQTESERAVRAAMEGYKFELGGLFVTLWDVYRGFSVTVSWGVMALGLVNVWAARQAWDAAARRSWLGLSLLLMVVFDALWIYFRGVPPLTFGIPATICLAVAWKKAT